MKLALLAGLALAVGCGGAGDDTTTTTIEDNRVCVINNFSGADAQLFQEAEFADISVDINQEGVVLCGDPVDIDSVIETNDPETLAKALAEGQRYISGE